MNKHDEKVLTEDRQREVEALNDLLVKNYDSEAGYKNALLDSHHEKIKMYFKKQALQRALFINELDKEIRFLNATPVKSGSKTGTAHRVWMDFKTAFTNKSDEAILEECIRGDKNAVAEYRSLLEDQPFTDQTRKVVQYQLNAILNTLDTIKKCEDIVD